jgi:Nucleoside-diphosphate-sugar epimerases
MNILVTGAKGFIGKNLIAELKNRNYNNIMEYDQDSEPYILDQYTKECDFIFHLAGINRPRKENEFMKENYGFTSLLLDKLNKNNNKSPILLTSSIQAELDNAYGKSKKAGEELLLSYGSKNGNKALIYRLPNVFGKWCRPNYNSVVATFCYNISHELEIEISDPSVVMNLVYIDDVMDEFINALEARENKVGNYCCVSAIYTVTLGKIAELIYSFKESRSTLTIPNMSNEFEKKLYSTYLSYLPEDNFSYLLKMNIDERGSFTEFFRTADRGQVSINVSKPGVVKGNHWHHTKNEKFLVVKGRGLIQFRKVGCEEVICYHVSSDKLEVIDIPIGYTHNIINEGKTDMVTVIWANEAFSPEKPDTFYLKVE